MTDYKLRDIFIKANLVERTGYIGQLPCKGQETDIHLAFVSAIRSGQVEPEPRAFPSKNTEQGTLLTVESKDYFVNMSPDDFKKKYGEIPSFT